MAFRVRVLHSLLLGLAGFSLVLCSFFYATPVTLRDQDVKATPAALLVHSTLQLDVEEPSSPKESETPSESGKRTLQASVDTASHAEQLNEQKHDISAQTVLTLENKEPTDLTVKQNISETSASSSLRPVEDSSKGGNNTTKHSVIQRIAPKTAAGKNSATNGVVADATSLGIVTRTMYEIGFDIPNPDLCIDFGLSLKVLILITSAPNHLQARLAIRQTWGHYRMRKDIAIAFLIGSTSDSEIQKQIYSESELYGDLIQSHFVDSYNNLTLKTISMLEWVDIYCHKVKFILKTDDDMFINIPKLLTFIDKHSEVKRTIFGRLAKKWKPIRNKKSKYYVSKEQYKNVLFPDFTTGPAYLLSGDVVHDLYTSALNQTYLKLEDVYTTGIVAQEMKVRRVHVNEFLNKKIVPHVCNVQKSISIHMVKFHEQFDLWKKLLDGKVKCK